MEEIPKSTQYYRANKEKCKAQQNKQNHTLNGKLVVLITTSRYRSKLKGFEHSIDSSYLKQIYSEQNGLCAISGIEMTIRGKNHAADSPYSISLDRIDPNKGYIPGNVWLVCTGVNLMKSRLSMDQFIDFCKKTVEHFA